MPFYDRICPNGHQMIDCMEPIKAPEVLCKECQKPTERAWFAKPTSVIPDEIPGGMWIRHGICNEDGTPRKYYSYSEMRKEAEKRNLVNWVEHVPEQGTDKSKYTTRWISAPVITEEERLAAWYEHERRLQNELAGREKENSTSDEPKIS